MATVFRHQGKERLLERRCGTTAYCAPEMLMKPGYNAEPSDIWSCGIVLVAMVTGELPWNQATVDMSDYAKWKDGDIEKSPHWQRVKDNLLLSLIKKTLAHYPTKRYTIEQIKYHLRQQHWNETIHAHRWTTFCRYGRPLMRESTRIRDKHEYFKDTLYGTFVWKCRF